MQKDLIKQWTQLSKKANEALKKINTLNTSSIKKLTKLQMDLVSKCLEGGIKKTRNAGKVSSMAELMNLQSSIYKELSEKVLEGAQNSVKIAMETKQAMTALVKEGMADAPSVVVKATVKKMPVKKAVAKKVAPKKVAPKAASKKVVAKKAASKPAAKKVAPKTAAKKVVAKKAAPKPTAKKVVAKKAVAKPVAKKVDVKPAKNLQMPLPTGRPVTEGDAKK